MRLKTDSNIQNTITFHMNLQGTVLVRCYSQYNLLKEFRNAGLEFHVNRMSASAFICIDITMRAPSRGSRMFQICEQYA